MTIHHDERAQCGEPTNFCEPPAASTVLYVRESRVQPVWPSGERHVSGMV